MKKNGLISKIWLLQVTLVTVAIAALMAFAPSQQNAEEEWTLLASENGVKAYVSVSDCGKTPVYIFKLENTTTKTADVNYTLNAFTDPTFPAITKEATLSPNQVLVGNCDMMWELAINNSSGRTTNLESLVSVTLTINP